MLSFTAEEIREFLADYGYTSNPEGLAQPFPVDFISENKTSAYLDVNADAVRKGSEVPDRPVRITFHVVFRRRILTLEIGVGGRIDAWNR